MEELPSSGLSDAMAKILQGKVKENNFILSKAKKDRDISIGKPKNDDVSEDDLEVMDDDGNTKRVQEEDPEYDDSSNTEVKKQKSKKTRRVKPDRRSTWDRESDLNALATKGVVQLFNAVNKHRNVMSSSLETTGKSERKRDKVLSKFSTETFMDILSSSKDSQEKKVVKKKRFQDVMSEDVEGTKIDEWESDDNSDN